MGLVSEEKVVCARHTQLMEISRQLRQLLMAIVISSIQLNGVLPDPA